MEITSINASQLADAFIAGAKYLEADKDHINELNVFPVPDGDTGTNMTMTIMSAAREVKSLTTIDMKSVSKAISSGSLRGARGNSGVILSQLFRGFTKVIKTQDELTVPIISDAFQRACETAYKAVMKPKEGTILTVAKAAAEKALELSDATEDIVYFFGEIVSEADDTLQKTPEMLPVLKQAGVVDSGGAGLVQVLKGIYDQLSGKDIDLTVEGASEGAPATVAQEIEKEEKAPACVYKTSFVLVADGAFAAGVEDELKEYFSNIGQDLVLTVSANQMSVALSTNEPGRAINRALKFGQITDVSVMNTKMPQAPKIEPAPEKTDTPEKEIGFVAVSIGDGLNKIFKELGADYIIEGGQTMNPSTADILNAIDKVNAKNVFVLPNNKNIVLAANQAVDLCETKNVVVLPTSSLPQGITAMINYIPDQTVEENKDRMTEEIKNVRTGEITYAVRDTEIDSKTIHKGDYMGIGDGKICSVDKDLKTAFLTMADELIDSDSALLSIYTGADAKEDVTSELTDELKKKYPDLEIEVQDGGQPVYYYVISVE